MIRVLELANLTAICPVSHMVQEVKGGAGELRGWKLQFQSEFTSRCGIGKEVASVPFA